MCAAKRKVRFKKNFPKYLHLLVNYDKIDKIGEMRFGRQVCGKSVREMPVGKESCKRYEF